MLEILWKVTTQVLAIEACGGFRTISAMGTTLHWGNSFIFKWSAHVDLNYHKLFHQGDIGYPHKECFS
jgi:hypothetical protein